MHSASRFASIAALLASSLAAQDALIVTAHGSTVARAWPYAAPPALAQPTNGDFSIGLVGWTPSIVGSGAQPGSVTAVGGARFSEGSSLFVELAQTFSLPTDSGTLEFDVYAVPGFDLGQASSPDAFEVSLLTSTGTIVPSWDPAASSFFNWQESGLVNLGSAATFDGQRVRLDVASIAPNTPVTLVLTMIGADADVGGGLTLGNIEVVIACSGAANSAAYGVGTAGPLGVPTLTLSTPASLGATVDVIVSNPFGQPVVACLALSPMSANVSIGPGAFLLVDITSPLLQTYDFVASADEGRVTFQLPLDPAWCGVVVFAQAGLHGPGASDIALTRGLAVTLGF